MQQKGSMVNLQDLKQYFVENWINVLVLVVVLGISAAASGIIYTYATNSLTSVSNDLLESVLENVKIQIEDYLETGTSTMSIAKEFLEDRVIDTGVVANPDLITASKYWGYMFKAAKTYSFFYVDQFGNNLGWGGIDDKEYSILLYWPAVKPGINRYLPGPNGGIANISDPFFYFNTTVVFPPLQIARESGKPYWQSIFFFNIGTTVQPLLAYVEPVYFSDTKEFCCIVGSNILVDAFEEVLATYAIGNSGKIFIASDDGTLIGDSNSGLQIEYRNNGENYENAFLPNATDNNDPALAHAAQFLVKKFGSFSQIPDNYQMLRFKHKGSPQLVLVGVFARENLKLHIVLVVPESVFFSEIDRSRRITIGLTVAASIVGAIRYLFMWRMMANKKKAAIAPMTTTSNFTESDYDSHSRVFVAPSAAALTFERESSASSTSSRRALNDA